MMTLSLCARIFQNVNHIHKHKLKVKNKYETATTVKPDFVITKKKKLAEVLQNSFKE